MFWIVLMCWYQKWFLKNEKTSLSCILARKVIEKSTRNHTAKHTLNKYTNIKRGPTLYPTLSPLLFITKLHRYLSPPPLGPTLHPPLPPPMPMVALLYVTLVGSYGVCLFWWLGLSFVYETYKKKILKKKQGFFLLHFMHN